MKVNALPSLLPFVQRICIFFFFQAEDGIRDLIVTGVQTCALPIDRKSTRLTPVTSRRRHTRSDRDWSQTCALPIDRKSTRLNSSHDQISYAVFCLTGVQTCALPIDRKSTRLNSSHDQISYAVFCLKKKSKLLNSTN